MHEVEIDRFFAPHPGVRCGVSSRLGGVSQGRYATLNLGGGTEDPPEAVAENRRRFYAASGLRTEAIARMHQVHGGRVVTAGESGLAGEADGLVAARPGLALLVTVADCLPVFLFDPESAVIGALHAGWRGIVGGVLEAGIEAARAAGAPPARLEVAIGPGIGPCCFEVGPEVAARFDPATHRPGRGTRPHLDLGHAARLRLIAAGVAPGAISGPQACTRCQAERYFSARAGDLGRMVGFIVRDGGAAGDGDGNGGAGSGSGRARSER
jgi:polyphenol oxidase